MLFLCNEIKEVTNVNRKNQFYDKENNLSLVKAGDEVKAKTKERKDYLLRIGAVIEKDEPKASTSK